MPLCSGLQPLGVKRGNSEHSDARTVQKSSRKLGSSRGFPQELLLFLGWKRCEGACPSGKWRNLKVLVVPFSVAVVGLTCNPRGPGTAGALP